jgi:hypothetical protein
LVRQPNDGIFMINWPRRDSDLKRGNQSLLISTTFFFPLKLLTTKATKHEKPKMDMHKNKLSAK